MDKHTPGPWIIATPTQGYEVCTMHGLPPQPTEDGCGQTWVYVRPETLFRDDKWHWPDEAEQLANAHLIAAAPDLLAALESMRDHPTIAAVCPSPLWAQMVNAILKARGETA
jgi:hypothetical protein